MTAPDVFASTGETGLRREERGRSLGEGAVFCLYPRARVASVCAPWDRHWCAFLVLPRLCQPSPSRIAVRPLYGGPVPSATSGGSLRVPQAAHSTPGKFSDLWTKCHGGRQL